MEVKNTYDKDTHGGLTSELLKIDPEDSCLTSSVSLTDTGNLKLTTVYNNIDYSAITAGNSENFTYRYFLSYLGTMGRKQLYSQLLNDETGVLDKSTPPRFEYVQGELQYTPGTQPSDVILNVDFRTREANILKFKMGIPLGGNSAPFQAVYRLAYPYHMDMLPNRAKNKDYFDGWYKQVLVIFRDVLDGELATKGKLYGYKGTSGLASISGVFVEQDGKLLIRGKECGKLYDAFIDGTYEENMLSISELTGIETLAKGIFADTQTLLMPEINQGIINELKDISLNPVCDDKCSIADWQKLQQKKLGAFIHFTEGNFRKAQVILESARTVCSTGKDCW